MLKPWLIVSPEYGDVIPVLDDGSGPMEYGADVTFVEAETRRDALLLGVALFRQQWARYLDDYVHPFEGVQVISQWCDAHRAPIWNRDHYECPQCEALLNVGGVTPHEKPC